MVIVSPPGAVSIVETFLAILSSWRGACDVELEQ